MPIVFSLVSFELILRKIPNDYKYKASFLENNAEDIEVLILGNSHSFFGVNPKYFQRNAFNASHVSQSFDYDKEILNKYKARFDNLKTIYIPVSYFSFWGKLKNGIENWRCRLYYPSYGFDKDITPLQFFEISGDVKMNSARLFNFTVNGKSDISCSKLGWGFSYKSENAQDLVETGILASKRHTRLGIQSKEYSRIYENNIATLNNIASWAQQNEIKLVLFMPPAFHTYRDNLNIKQLDLTIQTASNISKKYSNCSFINMLDSKVFLKEDFYDADHLSELGAKKLSIKLNDLDLSMKKLSKK